MLEGLLHKLGEGAHIFDTKIDKYAHFGGEMIAAGIHEPDGPVIRTGIGEDTDEVASLDLFIT